MLTPGMALPWGSSTVPVMPPNVCCADAVSDRPTAVATTATSAMSLRAMNLRDRYTNGVASKLMEFVWNFCAFVDVSVSVVRLYLRCVCTG